LEREGLPCVLIKLRRNRQRWVGDVKQNPKAAILLSAERREEICWKAKEEVQRLPQRQPQSFGMSTES